jgi:HEAT repeat protein
VSTPYLPPLDQLLVLGRPEIDRREPWPDYLAMGFTAEHVPELVRMAIDEDLAEGAEDDDPRWYGGVHAWRALGQLRAEAAVEPLVGLLDGDDDWAFEELPDVLGMIGPAAFEPLRAALAKWSLASSFEAGTAARGLVEIAKRFPETRDAAVAALARQLRWWARQDLDLNTMLVHDLVELNAVEAAPAIEEAFAADAVNTGWGEEDWEDVQVALGLLPERITPRPVYESPFRLDPRALVRALAPQLPAPRLQKKAAKSARRRKKRRR